MTARMTVLGAAGILAAILLPLLASGCLSFTFITVDQQTALEAQVLGGIAQLEQDLSVFVSVRGADEAPATFDQAEQAALRAMLNRRYNQDDLLRFKDLGCIAETRKGAVTRYACDHTREVKADVKLLDKLVAEENNDRREILTFVVKKSPDLTTQDMANLFQVFAAMMYRQAAPGHLLEQDNGQFAPYTP